MRVSNPIVVGSRFGRLTVMVDDGCRSVSCRCDCGGLRVAMRGALRGGRVLSCGCLRGRVSRHGASRSPLYDCWRGMRRRCSDPRVKAWARYGGRGIKVCAAWESFERFVADMGPRPDRWHSIDRIDNDGDYEPGNCRWATGFVQARNKPCKRKRYLFDGETKTLAEWATVWGMREDLLYSRIKAGWPASRLREPHH